MLLSLKKQWQERSFRRSAHMTPRSLQSQTINFADYDRSCTRNEMPSKHKKQLPVGRINVENIFNRKPLDTLASGLVSPHHSNKGTVSSVRDSTQRQFYYLEDNEIMSIDNFFSVYHDVVAHQKSQQKIVFKREMEKKRKKIEEMHSTPKKHLARSTTVSTVDLLNPSKNNSEVNYSIHHPAAPGLTRTKSFHYRVVSSGIPGNPKTPTTPNKISVPPSPEMSWRPERGFKRGLSMDVSSPKGMTTEQKFTEKEIYRHLACLTVSPKFMKKNVSPSQKEKNYSIMFKDPKTMDTAVENSIRKAHRMTFRYIGPSESCRAANTPDELSSTLSNRRIEGAARTKDDQTPEEESFAVGAITQKDPEEKQTLTIGKKIQDTIRRIDKALRSGSQEHSASRSPKNSVRSPSKPIIRVKNKYPLRSAIAQKYNLKEKLQDHKNVANKIKDVSNTFKKEAKESCIKSQTYLSYYH